MRLPMHRSKIGASAATTLAATALIASCAPTSAQNAGSWPPEIAHANEDVHPFFRHRLMVQGGASFNSISSFAQVASRSGSFGTHLSLEDDLGLEASQTTFDTMVRLRVFDRWMIEGAYFNVNRKRTVSAKREIRFGDHTFDAGGSLTGDIDIVSYRLAVGYAFYKDTRAEIGAAASLYVTDFGASLSGRATVDGVDAGFSTGTYSAPVPMPAIGLYAHYALTPRWLVSGRMDYIDFDISTSKWFGADLEDVGGHVLAFEVSTEYRLLDNIGVGIGYRRMDVDLSAEAVGLDGKAGYSFSAPTAFVRVDF